MADLNAVCIQDAVVSIVDASKSILNPLRLLLKQIHSSVNNWPILRITYTYISFVCNRYLGE